MLDTASNSFMVYPRGFVGAELSVVKKVNRGIQVNLTNIQNVITGNTGGREIYPHNEEVNALADVVMRELAIVRSFDFRKRILLAALSAFGTKSFYYWYQAQYRSPMFSDNHSRFVDDTMKFITTGKRDLDCTTWLRVLSFDESHPTYEITQSNIQPTGNMSEAARMFFNYPAEDQHLSLKEVIQRWTSHVGGFEDLVMTMDVMFGGA